jgi:hypothetical protein
LRLCRQPHHTARLWQAAKRRIQNFQRQKVIHPAAPYFAGLIEDAFQMCFVFMKTAGHDMTNIGSTVRQADLPKN